MRQLLASRSEVVAQTEEVDALFLLVPVAADALEAAGAVVEGVGHYADLGLGQRHELLLEIGVGRRGIRELLSRAGRAPL